MENLIMEIVEIVKLAVIMLALAALLILTIHQAITGEWFGLSDKVTPPWEKEERKKAKNEAKAARKKQWYE